MLRKIAAIWRRSIFETRSDTAIEYAMIAALIAAVMIGFAAALGTDVAGIFYAASSSP